jgi:hypothetical protein
MEETDDLEYGGRLWPEKTGRPTAEATVGARTRSARTRVVLASVVAVLVVGTLVAVGAMRNPGGRATPTVPSKASGGQGVAAGRAVSPLVDEPDSIRVDIYTALIAYLNQRRWKTVYVSSKLCNQFPMGRGKCSGELTHDEKVAIVAALPLIDLSFEKPPKALFSNYQENYGRYAHLTLSPIVMREDAAFVEAGYYCIYTCGFGTTYVLRETSGVWRVRDQVGESWIS